MAQYDSNFSPLEEKIVSATLVPFMEGFALGLGTGIVSSALGYGPEYAKGMFAGSFAASVTYTLANREKYGGGIIPSLFAGLGVLSGSFVGPCVGEYLRPIIYSHKNI